VLQKIYGNDANPEKRYSPAVCRGCKLEVACLAFFGPPEA
jgi:hypothetical protein